ncbi:FtsX-like permease family protein [Micromonospora sp. LOL_023]|uniref:FtsX-like permease family protein n=1 Tax=Micromonospora sp. LOL_023 TaxID=3345418 RepID=UPI003A8ADD89
MFALLLSAVRARVGQASALLLLTALAVTATTAAPWYAAAATRSVAQAAVDAAAPDQFAARATGRLATEDPTLPLDQVVDPATGDQAALDAAGEALLDQARAAGSAVIGHPGATAASSLWATGMLISAQSQAPVSLTHRERVCDHLGIDGACPQRPGEVLVSRRTAESLGVGVGDQIQHRPTRRAPVALTITGVYQVTYPGEPYWAFGELGTGAGTDVGDATGDPAFVTAGTLAAAPTGSLSADYHLVLPAEAFIAGTDVATEVRRSSGGSGRWQVRTDAAILVDLIKRHRQLVNVGVTVAAGQLLLLSWFALFFAVRHTAEHRRRDLGLVKLRGGARWRVWLLTVGQSGLPMIVGAAIGIGAGLVVARLLAGAGPDPEHVGSAARLAVAAAGTAVIGALIAAIAADLRNARAGVVDLLRHVPARQRGWRADAVDLIAVAIAAAGLYQAYTTPAESAGTSGLVLLSPALLAIAVALVAGRLATPVAARAGSALLRQGRLPAALAALHLARRPGTARLVALLTVAVALLGTAIAGWSESAAARAVRATHTTGAEQVLTVQARSRAHLLAAVRAADPAGRHAMAVVRNAPSSAQYMLAVDASRFAAVAAWHSSYGPAATEIAAALTPPTTGMRVSDGELRLDATGTDAVPVSVVTHLVGPMGQPMTVVFGPIGAQRAEYTGTVTGCGPDGCRLAAIELTQPAWSGAPASAEPGITVGLHGLAGDTSPRLDAAYFGDVRNWRGPVATGAIGPRIDTGQHGLDVTTPPELGPNDQIRLARIQVTDAPVPVPVVRFGPELIPTLPGEPVLTIFGGDALPVRYVGVADALPQVRIRGYLVDLELADRLAGGAGRGDVPQVWLAADVPDDLIDRLTAQGLTIIDTDSRDDVIEQLGRQGPPSALRFQLAAGLIGLLLAAGALAVVAAVERDDRAAELAALRRQGLPAAAVARIAYGGYAVAVGLAVLIGLLVTIVARLPIQQTIPIFVDNWAVLPLRIGPQPGPLLAAVLVATVVLGAAGALAGARLVRAVSARLDAPAANRSTGRRP